MKKLQILTMVFLLGGIAGAYAQATTSAPDQPVVTVQTNNGQTNISLNLGATDTNAATNTAVETNTNVVVTPEKEVVAEKGLVYNDGKTDYASADVRFGIQAKDDLSGVKQVYVMVDDSEFGPYESALSFNSEGKHLVVYKVEDNVGNISPLKYYEFILDKSGPEVAVTSDKKVIKIGDTLFVGTNYNFGIYAQDKYSGVKSVNYSIDDTAAASYDKPFAAIGTNGLHKIVFGAEDNVGNITEKQSYMFFIDANAPVVEFSADPGFFEKDGIKYIAGSTTIKLTAKDAETGVASIMYSVDGGDYAEYAYSIKLAAGAHMIKAKAVDLVGNVSAESEFAVTVDTAEPQVDLIPSK